MRGSGEPFLDVNSYSNMTIRLYVPSVHMWLVFTGADACESAQLVTASLNFRWFDFKTGDINQTSLDGLQKVYNSCLNMVAPYLQGLGSPTVVVELVSDRLAKDYRSVPNNMVVITSDNWEHAMGPVFGQRGRAMRALLARERVGVEKDVREKKMATR